MREANDLQQLAPMLAAIDQTLRAAGIPERPRTLLADSGYWSIANLTTIPDAPELLVWPASTGRTGKPARTASPRRPEATGCVRRCSPSSGSDHGRACYAKRKQTVEPVFGQLKEQQGARRFTRRGLVTCEAEWKLLCGTHNLLRLWRHTRRPASVAITT